MSRRGGVRTYEMLRNVEMEEGKVRPVCNVLRWQHRKVKRQRKTLQTSFTNVANVHRKGCKRTSQMLQTYIANVANVNR